MASERARYTRADVAARNGKGDAPVWMIYKDVVYDVTAYMHQHPGGADLVQDEAGRDVSKVFDEVGHTSDATTILKKYVIGELVEEEKAYDANGKKKKRLVKDVMEEAEGRSCLALCTCGLLA